MRIWLLAFFKQHIYLYIFILTTIEGPVTTFISAWLSAQGFLRIEYVALLAFLWDVIGDLFLYSIGRGAHKFKFWKKFKYFSKQKDFLEKNLKKNPFVYMLIVKMTPYLATPGLIFAWKNKMNAKLFTLYAFVISILVKIIYLTIGYFGFFGIRQLERFLNGWKQVAMYIIAGILLFLLTRRIYAYIDKKIKQKLS